MKKKKKKKKYVNFICVSANYKIQSNTTILPVVQEGPQYSGWEMKEVQFVISSPELKWPCLGAD